MIFSSVAHAALFAVALVGFSQPRSFEDYQEAVPVEVINENELRQMMRGERNAPKPLPAPQQKADRVAEVNERKPDAPLAKQDVEVPPPPQRDLAAEKAAQEKAAAAQREKEEQERAVREARAAEAQKQREAAEKQRVAALAAAAAEKVRQAAAEKARAEAEAKKEAEEEERREAELERQRKQEEARKAAEAKRIADEKRAAEDKKRKEAQALKEKLEREAEEEEERKQAELDKQKKAEEARKAAEAKRIADAKRAAEEKAKRDAEARQKAAQSDQKSFDPSDIQKILENKQRAASTGSTGPQPQRQASLGTQTGAAAKLNPSQREALIGILREQMTRCLSIPPGSNPSARPTIRVALNQDGSLSGAPAVASGDAALGAASVRAIRGCAPYRIPAKFAEFYSDWRSLLITIDLSDL